MNRIEKTFRQLAETNTTALIPYVTAGFPYTNITPALMHGMAEAGADIIELGIPFSDPSADGPTIQKASEKALAMGIGIRQVLDMVAEFRTRNTHTPVVLMGYANPIERYDLAHGTHAFARDAAAAGIDGLLVVDYPPEECTEFAAVLQQHGIDPIFLLAPTSTDERIQNIARLARGYVYYVSLKGITGSAKLDTDQVAQTMPRIKKHVKLPVGVGFGIRDAETARAIAAVSDAVIIGSRIIQLIDGKEHEKVVPLVMGFLREIRAAIDGGNRQAQQKTAAAKTQPKKAD